MIFNVLMNLGEKCSFNFASAAKPVQNISTGQSSRITQEL